MATEISQYWVGQIPGRPITIEVRNSDGDSVDFGYAEDFRVRMIDSRNREVDTTGSNLLTSEAENGLFVFMFPEDRSLFTEPGEYLLQLEILGPSSVDYTTTHSMRVRRLGGVR